MRWPRIDVPMGAPGNPVIAVYVIAAVIAVALVGYLCVALLRPEWFE
jgi:K+-transporting ATPase KdpF subunit